MRNVKTERVRQECYLSLIQLRVSVIVTVYSKCCTKEAFEGFGDFKTGGHLICTVKYANDLVLLCKEETAQLGMTDRLIQVGRHYGMETNVEKTTVMRIKNKPTQYIL
jgi:hypothetical protein